MYDDKWTEVNNSQNDQNNPQAGPSRVWEPDRDGSQPVRQQVYGLSGQGQPQNQNQGQAYQQPQNQNGPQNQYHHSSPYPYGDRTETAG